MMNPFRAIDRRLKYRFSCDINGDIPISTRFPHPVGIVIGSRAEIGEDVDIYQNVTIGSTQGSEHGYPVIGDNVVLYAGATVVNDIRVGACSVVGANSVVINDVPRGSTVVGAPARVVKYDE